MKKLFSVLMVLCLLMMSLAAVAEGATGPSADEKVVNWNDYKEKAAQFPGELGDLGNGKAFMYIPSIFKPSEITKEDQEKGLFLLLKTEDNLIVNGTVYNVDTATFEKGLTDKGAVATHLYLNEIHSVEFSVSSEAGNSTVIALPQTDNRTVVFTFTPGNDKTKDMFTVMAASIQSGK